MATIGQWLWYALQLPGCPFSACRDSADVILVPAFGRNKLEDKDLAGLRWYHDSAKGDDEITLAWCRDRVEVGQPNRSLAMELMDLVHHTSLPVIAQWEVLVPLPPSWYAHHRAQITCLWPSAKPGEYFSTRDILDQSLMTMSAKGWAHPIILAHAGQAMRVAMMLYRMTGNWPAVPPNLPDGFDGESVQPWTRNRVRWTLYEFLARGHHLAQRWV